MKLDVIRPALPDWPRLMGEAMAADYLSIGTTTLRKEGPEPRRIGRRCLWDRTDLDRWADRLAGQPLTVAEATRESDAVEKRWREKRKLRNVQGRNKAAGQAR